MLIGITGTLGAGKGSVVDYLVTKKGFRHVSARSIWAKELEARNIIVNRNNMVTLANQLRAEHGADYFMRLALETVLDKTEKVVIESVRTVAEAELLKARKGYLLAVNADIALRYKRIGGRGSVLDNVTFEEFIQQEQNEMTNEDPNKQNIAKVIDLADYKIINNGTLEELEFEINLFLASIRKLSI